MTSNARPAKTLYHYTLLLFSLECSKVLRVPRVGALSVQDFGLVRFSYI
jgi:hypothetical protein